MITVILQCRLVSFNWDESQNNLYINIKVFLFSVGIANLLFDIIVVALPILPILKLHLNLSQKLSLLGIFLLAGLYVSHNPSRSSLTVAVSVLRVLCESLRSTQSRSKMHLVCFIDLPVD